MRFEIIREINRELYKGLDHFVSGHPDGNFFQHPETFSFYKKVRNFEPVLICAFGGDGELAGSVLGSIQSAGKALQRSFTRRLIIQGGPLVGPGKGSRAVLEGILAKLGSHVKKRVVYTEIRNMSGQEPFRDIFTGEGYIFSEHLNYLVRIGSETEKAIHKGKLRQIRKSLDNGLSITESSDENEVIAFYRILSGLYRKKVRKPLPDISFFLEFGRNPKLGKYFLVKKEGEVLGGMMCPIFAGTIYEWYVAAARTREEGIYPGVVATWAPIHYAIGHNLEVFDFLGAGKPGEDYGVRKFKSGFGGELVNFGRYLKINRPGIYSLGKAAIGLAQKIS